MCSFLCCGAFCSGLSVFCGIALLITGLFLALESPSIYVPIDQATHTRDYHSAAVNCFVGAGIYAGVLALSIVCICVGKRRAKKAPQAQPLPVTPVTTSNQ